MNYCITVLLYFVLMLYLSVTCRIFSIMFGFAAALQIEGGVSGWGIKGWGCINFAWVLVAQK